MVPIHKLEGRRDGSLPRHSTRGGRRAIRPPDAVLFALGQHRALVDIYVVCTPKRVGDVYAIFKAELFAHVRISVHHVKIQVWNRGGVVPMTRLPESGFQMQWFGEETQSCKQRTEG